MQNSRTFTLRKAALRIYLVTFWVAAFSVIQSTYAQAPPSGSTDFDLAALLQRMQANVKVNDKIAQSFVADESYKKVALDKKGKKKGESSGKFECISINGLPYSYLVEENGKTFNAEQLVSARKRAEKIAQLGVGKDYALTVKGEDPRLGVYSSLPICCLATLFDNRVIRREQINGRDNLVIESVPKAIVAATTNEQSALDWKGTTWIDLADLMPTRYEAELLKNKRFLAKGTRTSRDFARTVFPPTSNESAPTIVWLSSRGTDGVRVKFLWMDGEEDSEETWYNFRRFKVDLHILDDSVQPASDQH